MTAEEKFRRAIISADKALLVKENGHTKLALIKGKYHERNIETGQISLGNFDRLELELKLDDANNTKLSYSLEEMPMDMLWSKLSDEKLGARAMGELVDRVSFPSLNLLLAWIGAFGFLTSSFSRHGYKRAITFGVVIGLFVEAFVFSLRGAIGNNPSLFILAFVPIPAAFLVLFLVKRHVRGPNT